MSVELIEGDSREVLKELGDCSVDSVVTDPPYALTSEKKGGTGLASLNIKSPAGRAHVTTGFMGKAWDNPDTVHDPAFWAEVLRVLKPGGHVLAFGGTRTYHRLACAIEDAGFEIRDMVGWIYGSGFPKSHDVSKGIDRAAGVERQITRAGTKQVGGYGDDWDTNSSSDRTRRDIPATDAAAQWEGWGTALKPSQEPICMARKPLIGTVAANVLAHGTGAINVDGCRVDMNGEIVVTGSGLDGDVYGGGKGLRTERQSFRSHDLGRWPANLIHDGSDEVIAAFPESRGQQGDLVGHSKDRKSKGIYGDMPAARDALARNDSGSAARFFYCAKASKADRDDGLATPPKPVVTFQTANGTSGKASSISEGRNTEYRNTHPTVKPTDLMRYLCRLVTPPGGTVLDPFMGSGSTGRGAVLEGFSFIGIEMMPEYFEIADARIAAAERKVSPKMQAAE